MEMNLGLGNMRACMAIANELSVTLNKGSLRFGINRYTYELHSLVLVIRTPGIMYFSTSPNTSSQGSAFKGAE